jgi:hypothetical protein
MFGNKIISGEYRGKAAKDRLGFFIMKEGEKHRVKLENILVRIKNHETRNCSDIINSLYPEDHPLNKKEFKVTNGCIKDEIVRSIIII